MPESAPGLLALDFDGVLCDGLKEYFQTSWRAYCELWSLQDTPQPPGRAEAFYRLRPVIETGWEMPLVLRALDLGISEDEILQGWGAIAQSLLQQENLQPATLGGTVDRLRDEWIAADLDSWLQLHASYPGVNERLLQLLHSPIEVVIISTKESRFIRQLLARQGIDFPGDQVFGKELKQPKAQTLRTLRQQLSSSPTQPISTWFVEDRFKTLETIQTQPDLADVHLFLADWGYNTAAERDRAIRDPRVQLLTLDQFSQDFAHWEVRRC